MIAGRYSLERELGRGGMGAVWLARDELLGRAVALKRLGANPLGEASPALDRSAREARLAARLNHPHVVAVFDLVAEGPDHWLVMEYVEGSTLAALIRARGRLAPDHAAALLAQVADALVAAHRSGIVHRDVKPSNILVAADGQAKLSDFGIARGEADATLTGTGLVTGSPAYLAPEIASGRAATEASDVWSLGATLFHALAGRPPYDVGENLLGALYRIVHDEPPRLADAGWLGPLLDHTMVRDPSARWTPVQVRDFLASGPRPQPAPRRRTRTPAPAPVRVPPTPEPGTQVLAATPEPVTPVPRVPQGPPARPRRRVGGVLGLLVAVALVAIVTVAAFAVSRGGDGSRSPVGGAAPTAPSAPTTPPGPDEAGMRAFVLEYLTTAAADPDAGYAMLTPAFQVASGELDGYRRFWGQVQEVRDVEVTEADPESLQVGYTYRYRTGEGVRTDEVRLQLAYQDGRYLVAEEPGVPGV